MVIENTENPELCHTIWHFKFY